MQISVRGGVKSQTRGAVRTRAVAQPAQKYHRWYQPAGKGLGFYNGDDGYMYCDTMKVEDVRHQVPESLFYLYR